MTATTRPAATRTREPLHDCRFIRFTKRVLRCWSTAGARIALSAGNRGRCGLLRHTGQSTAKKAKFRGTIARSAGSVFYRISTGQSDGSLSGFLLVRGCRASRSSI